MAWPTTTDDASTLFTAVNNLQTTLNGAIDASTTTVVLTSASACPATGGYITIGTEAIKYTGKSTNTLTGVTRGADGTTATLHADLSPVFGFLVANHHNAIKDAIIALETYALPTAPGVITMYGGETAPTGWLLCNGAAISRTTYSTLFGIVSTTFGAGDGSTTFNVPDMRGVFPKGAGTTTRAAGVDASGTAYAATLGAYAQDKMQGHIHSTPTNAVANTGSGLLIPFGSGLPVSTQSVSNPSTDDANGTPRTGHTTEPQSLGLTYIIKS